jgi:hypothetical protein
LSGWPSLVPLSGCQNLPLRESAQLRVGLCSLEVCITALSHLACLDSERFLARLRGRLILRGGRLLRLGRRPLKSRSLLVIKPSPLLMIRVAQMITQSLCVGFRRHQVWYDWRHKLVARAAA